MGFLRYGGGSFLVVLVAHRKGHGGGRPPAKCNKNICFRLTLQEYQDLRRAAIAEGCSMADILRQAVQRLKRKHKQAGTWPETAERE